MRSGGWAAGRPKQIPVATISFSVWENWIFFFLLSGFVSIFPTFIVRSAVQAQIALRPHEWLPIDPGAVCLLFGIIRGTQIQRHRSGLEPQSPRLARKVAYLTNVYLLYAWQRRRRHLRRTRGL